MSIVVPVIVIAVLVLAVAAIIYVWQQVTGGSDVVRDRQPGSVLDGSESVRRVDLGTNGFIGQAAKAEFDEMGLTTRVVSHEEGAFGIGMGTRYMLVYNAEDEGRVLPVVDRLLADFRDDGAIDN